MFLLFYFCCCISFPLISKPPKKNMEKVAKKPRVATNLLFRFKVEQPERFGVFLTYLLTMMDTCTFSVINAQDPTHQQDQITNSRLRHDKNTSADFSGLYVEGLDKHMVALIIAKFPMTVLETVRAKTKLQFTLDLGLLSKMIKSLTTDQQMEVYVKDTEDQLVYFDVSSLTHPHFRRTMYISMLELAPENTLTIEDKTYAFTVHMPMASFQGVMKTCDALQALWVKLYVLKREDHAVLVFQLLGEGQHAYSEHCFLMNKDQEEDYVVQETTLVGKEENHKLKHGLEIIFADNFPVKYLKAFGNTAKITFRLHPQRPIVILQKIIKTDDQSSVCAIVPPTAEDLQDHPLENFPGSYQA